MQLSCNLFTCLFGMYAVHCTWQLIVTIRPSLPSYHLSCFIACYLPVYLSIHLFTHSPYYFLHRFLLSHLLHTLLGLNVLWITLIFPSCHDFSLSVYIFYSKAFMSLFLSLFLLLSVIFFVLSKLFFDFDLLRSKKGTMCFGYENTSKKKEKRGMRVYLCRM